MLAKAPLLPADQVFLDLEDAVAPAEKTPATRQLVVEALRRETWLASTRVVRVNGVGTPWCVDDIVHVTHGAGDGLDCLMIPKVEAASQIHFIDELLGDLERKLGRERPIGLEIQIESPRGLVEIERIANASRRIETLIFGPGDYAAAAGIPQLSVGRIEEGYPGDQWHYVLSRIATTARAFGLQAIDGPYAAIRDLDGYQTVAERSRLLGFDGKWVLHPDQLPIANATYSPSQDMFERALDVLIAYEEATDGRHQGAVMFDAEMIDEASRKMAAQVVATGQAIGLQRR
jgi:citrate lyase subunit beta / citryl-CoA lyase